jgi:hypothetical protein
VAVLVAAVIAAPALADGSHAYTVTTLAGSGPGSLAAAIEGADAQAGRHDERARIVFSVAGEIALGAALPAITVPLEVDATTAPGYADGAPVVEIDGGGTLPAGGSSAWRSAASKRASSSPAPTPRSARTSSAPTSPGRRPIRIESGSKSAATTRRSAATTAAAEPGT